MNKKIIIITSSITAVVVILITSLIFMSPIGVRLVGCLSDSPITREYGKLLKIDRIIDEQYMGNHNSKHLMNMAMHAYVAALNDPYSAYYSQTEYAALNDELGGSYRGIGVVVKRVNDEIIIKEVNPGSPAEKAGLCPGDVLLAVNGKAYVGSQLSEAVNAIKSTKIGETVVLTLRRSGEISSANLAFTIGIVISSGTNCPCEIYFSASIPTGVFSAIAFLKISPVDICGKLVCFDKIFAIVPFPLPGAPKTIIFIFTLIPFSCYPFTHYGRKFFPSLKCVSLFM